MTEELQALLNGAGLCALCLSADFEPVLLSSQAAELLGIRSPDFDAACRTCLQPLIEFAREAHVKSAFSETAKSVLLKHTGGQVVPALAAVRPLGPSAAAAWFVEFHPLGPLESALEMLTIARKTRHLSLAGALAESAAAASEENTDLSASVSIALSAIDSLVPSAVEVKSPFQTSALVAIAPLTCARILGLLLLEAADFAFPVGKVVIRIVVQPAEHEANRRAELHISAERLLAPRTEGSLLARHLIRQTLASWHSFYSAEEEGWSAKKRTGSAHGAADHEVHALNIQIARELAAESGVHIRFRRLRRDLLAMVVDFPLIEGNVAV